MKLSSHRHTDSNLLNIYEASTQRKFPTQGKIRKYKRIAATRIHQGKHSEERAENKWTNKQEIEIVDNQYQLPRQNHACFLPWLGFLQESQRTERQNHVCFLPWLGCAHGPCWLIDKSLGHSIEWKVVFAE